MPRKTPQAARSKRHFRTETTGQAIERKWPEWKRNLKAAAEGFSTALKPEGDEAKFERGLRDLARTPAALQTRQGRIKVREVEGNTETVRETEPRAYGPPAIKKTVRTMK